MRGSACVLVGVLGLVAAGCGDDGSSGTSDGTTAAPETESGGSTLPTTGISDPTVSSGSEGSTAGGSETTDTSASTTDGSSTTQTVGSEGSSTTAAGECTLVLAEALYDAQGADDGLQWVKLYNPCDVTFDLTMFSLGYGGSDYTTTLQLDLSVSAGGCFVVGGPTSSAANGSPNLQQLADFTPDLDLATTVGGGIALFDVPAASVDANTVPIDAVVYGPNNDNGLVDDSGMPVPAPHVDNPPEGGSIRRFDFGSSWETTETPSPAMCPPF